ncbi:AAA family ATPase [Amycolatopsis rifamycinica]|uniref:ATPase AAA-type core domain-containing protein n=1 Tax=Amycolatopsis rifamycinica TaxID=287986 RepID=A0A066TZH1_9PSEU|nr:ATP-binding protein [Amycolatopsis rifamycinica]KDN19012.1 hypothetical protein DV20_27785 [Amycolatopsis rifamycinica]
MLRSFRLGNHRSFRDEQELLLMPALPGDSRPVVPVAAVYGANASGKSNLLDGLYTMRQLVRSDLRSTTLEEGCLQQPFRLDPASKAKGSTFVVELVLSGTPYTYGFVVARDEVMEEWLYSYPEKRKRLLFERQGRIVKFGSTVADVKAKLELLEEMVRPDALFLSLCRQLAIGPLVPVFDWFRSGMRMPSTARFSRHIHRSVSSYLSNGDTARLRRMVALLQAADVGIVDLEVNEVSRSVGLRDDQVMTQREVVLLHGDTREPFDLHEESSGTRNWLALLPAVLEVLDSGSLLVVDEIDASLHPLLTAKLVGLFADERINAQHAQLVFTTHDTSLLGTMLGDQVLERDQVWFVERNAAGASELYPLTDFKPRNDQNIERRYLGGSYGAVPVLGDFFEAAVRK